MRLTPCAALSSLFILQSAGDIVALFGIECASSDTFTDGSVTFAMTSIKVSKACLVTL